MQGFEDEYVCFLGFFCILFRYPAGQKFHQNHSISPLSEINLFLHFMQKLRWLPRMVGKLFWEKSAVDSADIPRVKNFIEIALSHTISKINAF